MKDDMTIEVIGNAPVAMSAGANGMDVSAAETVVIPAGGVALVPTGTRIQQSSIMYDPEDDINVATLALPRSSLAKSGLMLANSVGLIDTDYQGDIGFMFYNRTDNDITVEQGTRLGQLLFVVALNPQHITFRHVEEFTTVTERGAGGWGSTGNAIEGSK